MNSFSGKCQVESGKVRSAEWRVESGKVESGKCRVESEKCGKRNLKL